MANIVKVLKEEIARIAKREAKIAITKPQKSGIANKKTLVDIKRRLVQLEKSIKAIQGSLKSGNAVSAPTAASDETKAWLTGKGIKSLRKRMKISQAAFAKLVGVSTATIIRCEQKAGKLTFRGDTQAKIVALRGVGVQEAQKRLSGLKKNSK